MSDVVIEAYTDGACSGNPGPGGWGVLLRAGDHEKELNGGEADTTNNRMEMTAAIKALQSLKKSSSKVVLYTDSTYLKDGITKWIAGWKRNGWKTAAKKPVKNKDLWEQLDGLVARHDVELRWVKGHAGHPENERADALAVEGARRAASG
ncbi:MAG: ribonuclease HI [Pseudomonadota bacterium]